MSHGKILLVTNPQSSSGLGGYINDALVASGRHCVIINPLASKLHKLWPVVSSLDWSRKRMWRKRWENTLFSVRAWNRNSEYVGSKIDKLFRSGDSIMMVAKEYFPHPQVDKYPYYVFIQYTMALSLADGVTPWLPPIKDRDAFIELEKILYSQAAHVFVSAYYVKRHLVEKYGVESDRITVAGGGIHPVFEKNMAVYPKLEMSNTIIFVGWDFGMKGGDYLLQAFVKVRKEIPSARLMIVGPTRPVARQDGVVWIGPVNDKLKLLNYYRQADIFVMPSLRDSFGFVFLEAMSQGLPCIGTAINAMPEIISNGETGFVVPPRNAEALADAIIMLLKNDILRINMGMKALERVRQNYTWRRTAECILRIMVNKSHSNSSEDVLMK